MIKVDKFNFWTSIMMSGIAVLSVALYLLLGNTGVIQMHKTWYLFIIGFTVTIWVPVLLELIFKLNVGKLANISYQSFLILSIIVGSLWGVYSKISFYDTLVHILSGVLIAIIAYSLYKNSGKNNKLSLIWLFVLIFSVSMMSGGLWEIWEFLTDIILDGNSQCVNGLVGRDAVMDTMVDLLCDFGGGLFGASVSVIVEIKNQKPHKLNVDK